MEERDRSCRQLVGSSLILTSMLPPLRTSLTSVSSLVRLSLLPFPLRSLCLSSHSLRHSPLHSPVGRPTAGPSGASPTGVEW